MEVKFKNPSMIELLIILGFLYSPSQIRSALCNNRIIKVEEDTNMKQRIRTFFSLLIALMICTLEVPVVYANEPKPQPAMWFMNVVKFTQKPGGSYSHEGTLNFDVVGMNNSDIFAPFDSKVVAIYKTKAEGNTVVIESLAPVLYADGSVDYMTKYIQLRKAL